MKFRVKQISETEFLAEYKKSFLFLNWEYIDRKFNYTWGTSVQNSIHSSLEESKESIERYSNYLKNIKQYPKYWKIKL